MDKAAEAVVANIPKTSPSLQQTGNTVRHDIARVFDKQSGDLYAKCTLNTVATSDSVVKYLSRGLFGSYADANVTCVPVTTANLDLVSKAKGVAVPKLD